jgi:hypothetical protein
MDATPTASILLSCRRDCHLFDDVSVRLRHFEEKSRVAIIAVVEISARGQLMIDDAVRFKASRMNSKQFHCLKMCWFQK